MEPLLSIDGLTVSVDSGSGQFAVLRDVSLRIERGDSIGLVGESGCGKTMLALAILGLLPPVARIIRGRIRLDGVDLVGIENSAMQTVRGGRVGMVFQEPMTVLNPVLTIGYQVAQTVRAHSGMSRVEARSEAERLLDMVEFPLAAESLEIYSHELSGGQLQRVVIALALAGNPDLLIADEPTTALDVTVQAQVLDLLSSLRRSLGLGILLISHNLAVVAESCDRVSVMYAGEIVEEAAANELFTGARHPYTKGLVAATPRIGEWDHGSHLEEMPGQAPDPSGLPAGCAFHPRCSSALDDCSVKEPGVFEVASGTNIEGASIEGGTGDGHRVPGHTARCFLCDATRN